MQIYPSILEENLENFTIQFEKLAPFFDHFQIDIADGEFVEHRTVQIEELRRGLPAGRQGWGDGVWQRGRGVEEGIGGKTFEFHLMANDYKKDIEKLHELSQILTITQVLVHLKPFLKNPLSSPLHLSSSRSPYPPITSSDFNLGLVLSPEDLVVPNLSTIQQFNNLTIQIMTIEPGFQGNKFIPEMLLKINELREHGFTGQIILDGGINDQSLPIILKNKYLPDAVCPGSYLHEDTEQRLRNLLRLIETHGNS
ncbi:hypothetical protein A3A56_03515 [Candidatus Roizmanbacteria bacterium RIFCSPLOWO2_01_FULL_40_32]|nr:MAG: hypothetical protein A3A56_03515 [Candidatus Roizmanbacteria bacterium RIFCSPLOWO2_01_FULL_40_32]